MFRTILLSISILCLAFLGSPALAQQTTTGAVQGSVQDANKAPIAGATVTLTSAQGTRNTTTDSKGAFRFPYLIPGMYGLSARREGFNTVEHSNVDVRLGQTVSMEITLQPTSTEKVEVIASAPTVDVTTATTGTNIKTDVLASIPSNRTFASALDLAPGVTGSGIDQSNPSIGGASGLENTIVIDGVNINNTGYGSAGSYSIVLGSLGNGVNFDYLDEIQVKTGGYEPEFGEALGGYVNMITKSGTNDVRGSLYSYVQAGGLEASRVNQSRLNAVSDIREFQSTDYGFTLGGPFKKDKLFWFFALDPTFRVTTRETPVATQEALGFSHTLDVNRNIYNYAANLKWLLNDKNTFTLSAFGDPSKGDMGAQRPRRWRRWILLGSIRASISEATMRSAAGQGSSARTGSRRDRWPTTGISSRKISRLTSLKARVTSPMFPCSTAALGFSTTPCPRTCRASSSSPISSRQLASTASVGAANINAWATTTPPAIRARLACRFRII